MVLYIEQKKHKLWISSCLSFFFQLYVAAVSPARDEKATYVAWGHSTVVNPW